MTESSEQNSVAAMTPEIVSAYVSHNQIATAELAGLISAVAGQLGRIGSEPEQPAEKRWSLPCRFALAVAHGLTPVEYRNVFDFKPDYPMVAPNYSTARSELARRIGLGRPKKSAARSRTQTPAAPE